MVIIGIVVCAFASLAQKPILSVSFFCINVDIIPVHVDDDIYALHCIRYVQDFGIYILAIFDSVFRLYVQVLNVSVTLSKSFVVTVFIVDVQLNVTLSEYIFHVCVLILSGLCENQIL